MSHRPDEDDRLTIALRALASPEPPSDFLAGARRRYTRALEARCRRETLTALLASALGLGIAATLVLSVVGPVALVAWVAGAAAEATTWMAGVAVVLATVPPALWALAVLAFVGSLVPFVLHARAGSPVAVK